MNRKGRKRKLSPEIEAQICAWAAQARTVSDWARKLGVCCSTIDNVIARGNGRLTTYQRYKLREYGVEETQP